MLNFLNISKYPNVIVAWFSFAYPMAVCSGYNQNRQFLFHQQFHRYVEADIFHI